MGKGTKWVTFSLLWDMEGLVPALRASSPSPQGNCSLLRCGPHAVAAVTTQMDLLAAPGSPAGGGNRPQVFSDTVDFCVPQWGGAIRIELSFPLFGRLVGFPPGVALILRIEPSLSLFRSLVGLRPGTAFVFASTQVGPWRRCEKNECGVCDEERQLCPWKKGHGTDPMCKGSTLGAVAART